MRLPTRDRAQQRARDVNRAAQLRRAGLSTSQIATRLGVSRSTVAEYLRRQGLTLERDAGHLSRLHD